RDLLEKVERILTVLDAANAPGALDLPGYRLHQLRGDLRGYWSVTVRANWRIIFRFSNGQAQESNLSIITERGNTVSMKNPVHPGRIVKHDCLEALDLSVTAGAKVLGVSRQTLNNIVNEKTGISPEMAIRLSKAFGSTPESWLQMQVNYDLAEARRH